MLDVRQNAFCLLQEKQKGFQMQDFNIKEGKKFSLGCLDITWQPRYLSLFLGVGGEKGKQRQRIQPRASLHCRGLLHPPVSSRFSENSYAHLKYRFAKIHLDFPLAGSSSSIRLSFRGQLLPRQLTRRSRRERLKPAHFSRSTLSLQKLRLIP